MKEIVVISGKGGTGKTSLTASFAYLGADEVVVADCDVDAADMHLLLKPDFKLSHDFFSGVLARIDQSRCIKCARCQEVCRFDAIKYNGKYSINELDCEGCGYCARICPEKAIDMEEQNVGKWYVSNTKVGNKMFHAKLGIGAENSGKLVARVKKEARNNATKFNKNYLVVDGSPGIGCPVISSLAGADYVVLISEPTVSGVHDLKRVYHLVEKFEIPAACIINKYDLNEEITNEVKNFCEKNNINHIASLPYDENFTKAMTSGQTIVEYDNSELSRLVEDSWQKIKKMAME